MSPEEKITKARVQMISKQPFFGVLCMSLRFKPDPNEDTAAVTPYGVVYYNPDYIKKLTTEQVKGLICHEVMHVALRHLEREEGRDHFKANIAQDLAINPLILQTFQLPPGALYMREYEGMSWEEIYDKLSDPKRFECNGDCDNCPFKQKNPNGFGGVPSVVVVCRKRGSLDKHVTRKDIEEARRKVEDGVISRSDLDKLGIPKGALDDKETVNWRKVLKDAWHHAKCLDPNTQILMADKSFKRITDVKKGDEILGIDENGNIAKGVVLQKFRTIVNQKVTIEASNGSKLVCSPEHFIYNGKFTKAEDLDLNTTLPIVTMISNEEVDSRRDRISETKLWSEVTNSDIKGAQENKNICVQESSQTGTETKTKISRDNKLLSSSNIREGYSLLSRIDRWRGNNNYPSQKVSKKDKRQIWKNNKDLSESFLYSNHFNIQYFRDSNGLDEETGMECTSNKTKESTLSDQVPFLHLWIRDSSISRTNRTLSKNQENTRKDMHFVDSRETGTEQTGQTNREDERVLERSSDIKPEKRWVSIKQIKKEDTREVFYDLKTSLGNYIANGFIVHNSMGKAPLGIERLIEDLVEPQINWLEYLPQLIVRHMPYDYTYSRPSKKSIAAGYYLPSVLKSGIKGVVVIDTSGSMSMEDLRDGLSQIIGIFREVPNAELTIYSCDAMLYEAQTITSEYDLNTLQLKGGGGTDFRPMFQKIQEGGDDVDLLIYITDGYGEYPTPDMINPNMTVIWVITRDGDETRVPDYFDLVVKIK